MIKNPVSRKHLLEGSSVFCVIPFLNPTRVFAREKTKLVEKNHGVYVEATPCVDAQTPFLQLQPQPIAPCCSISSWVSASPTDIPTTISLSWESWPLFSPSVVADPSHLFTSCSWWAGWCLVVNSFLLCARAIEMCLWKLYIQGMCSPFSCVFCNVLDSVDTHPESYIIPKS